MAFFKFRKGGDEPLAAPHPPESVEAMRRRARHRLIGAAVLVLAGVIGFPLLFDTQPRPIAIDIPIDIPDRTKSKPLAPPVAVAAAEAKSEPKVPVASANTASAATKREATTEPRNEPVAAPVVAAPKSEPKADAKPEAKAPAIADAKSTPAPRPSPEDGNKARALLEGTPAPAEVATAEGRFVVQVGAFADGAKAREARQKVERAGLKTYTHVAETKEGKRIRVRVGPFASRAEADKAADRIKGLDLPAAILTL